MKNIILSFIPICVMLSCREPAPSPSGKTTKEHGVYITNEGTFNSNTASLGWYDFEKNQYEEKLYRNANNRPLGDILQNMYFTPDRIWLTVNNSNKVLVLDAKSHEEIKEIAQLESPRYLLPVSDEHLWVSDWKSGEITVIDREELEVKQRFDFSPGWSEQMVREGRKVWITHPSLYSGAGTYYIYGVDVSTGIIEDSIHVLASPVAIIPGASGEVWVYCQGHARSKSNGGIVRVSLKDKVKIDSILFEDISSIPLGVGIAYDSSTKRLYYLRSDIFLLEEGDYAPRRIIAAEGKNYYALGYIASRQEIFVSDAVDFVQRGVVERYDTDGNFIGSFTAGIIPNGFYEVK